jgi:hypothetical protein
MMSMQITEQAASGVDHTGILFDSTVELTGQVQWPM